MPAAYESCEWIEGGLSFNRRSLHACLITHHHRGMPHYADHDGGPVPVDAVLAAREAIRAQHRAGEINEACRGCAHLRKREWPERDRPFDIVGIAHYSHCNIACNYCFLQTQDRSTFEAGFDPYEVHDALETLYASGQLAPDAVIDWGGGEPTIYREFDRIVQATLERGALHYLHTNGVRFPEFVDGHPRAGNIHVICSVDAGRPETYRAMKGRDFLAQVWVSLERYVACGCRVTVKYIVKDENASEADTTPFLERVVALGIGDLILDIDYDFPDVSRDVIDGLVRLKVGALGAGMHVRYGFTGDNFASESGAGERFQAAFDAQQITILGNRLEAEHYVPGEMIATTIESLIADLKRHVEAKDASIIRMSREMEAKDALIHRLDEDLGRTFPQQVSRWLARLGS